MERQSSISLNGIDSETPVGHRLAGKYTRSFAYYTLKDRLPVILTKVIDQLARDKEELITTYGPDVETDIKAISGKISKLKNEVQTNKQFIEIESDGEEAKLWNKYLEEIKTWDLDEEPCWFHSPWLYAENYMYRRLWEAFETSKLLVTFDPFFKQKQEGLDSVKSQLTTIQESLLGNIENIKSKDTFLLALKMSLWSNRCDLSITDGSVISHGNLFSEIINLDQMLLADDSNKTFSIIQNDPNGVIDIVHDNTGIELFSDLVFADLLIRSSLATKVRFHCKRIPWYVSDVTINDFHHMLNELSIIGLNHLVDTWKGYLRSKQWELNDETFWTLPFPYDEMLQRDSCLYEKLAESKMVIFKGDLNYRKLLGDIYCNPEDSFSTVLRRFRPTNVVSLRTVKADIIAGVSEQKVFELNQLDPLWMRTGHYGVIQCCSIDN